MNSPQIAFVCDIDLPNYLDKPRVYDYLEGKHSATGYYYWILKNAKEKNIHLVNTNANLNDYDIVVIYYENKNVLSFNRKYRVIQVVSDRPQIENCDLYVACNQSAIKPIVNKEYIKMAGLGLSRVLKGKWHFIHYPMARNYTQCSPAWPPSIYHFTGRKSTLLPEIYDSKFIKHLDSKGIRLRFDFENDHNTGDEDVYFCVRNSKKYFSTIANGNNVDTELGQKTANRLYQAWKMGTPSIFDPNTPMLAIRKSPYDFLIASNAEEFEASCLMLKEDCNLFKKMKEVCLERQNEHNDNTIVMQWREAFEKVK